MRGIPGDHHAPLRFVKAAFVNAFYPQKAIEQDNVMRLPGGLCERGSVGFGGAGSEAVPSLIR